jgi:pilus assembly protein Flp/PilA
MKNIQQLMKNLIEEESGQDLIEYALVAALVGLGSVASMSALASTISNTFANISTLLDSATS